MTDEIAVEFEHRDGWERGQVSLPTGLRDKAEISDGTFTVDFPATESLVSNPTFRRLVEAGHTPIDLPEEQAESVQRQLAEDTTADTSSDDGDSTGDDGADSGDESREPDSLDEKDRSELYELAHKLDAVPDDEIPTWNDSTAPGLRDLIRAEAEDEYRAETE